MTGRILPPISAILPLWLVRSMVGWRETAEVWPALAVSGISFAAMQFYWSNFQENGLVDIVAAIFSLLVMVAFLRIWQPRTILTTARARGATSAAMQRHSTAAVLKGWSPFILASILIFVAGLPALNSRLTFASLRQPVPALHNVVYRVPPVVPAPAPEAAIADLNVIALPGTAVFAGAALAAMILGMPVRRLLRILGRTFVDLVPSLLAISFMVGLAFVGKMIDAQSIIVAATATQQVGREAAIFKAVFGHSLVLASLVGLIVVCYAFVIPWIIPR